MAAWKPIHFDRLREILSGLDYEGETAKQVASVVVASPAPTEAQDQPIRKAPEPEQTESDQTQHTELPPVPAGDFFSQAPWSQDGVEREMPSKPKLPPSPSVDLPPQDNLPAPAEKKRQPPAEIDSCEPQAHSFFHDAAWENAAAQPSAKAEQETSAQAFFQHAAWQTAAEPESKAVAQTDTIVEPTPAVAPNQKETIADESVSDGIVTPEENAQHFFQEAHWAKTNAAEDSKELLAPAFFSDARWDIMPAEPKETPVETSPPEIAEAQTIKIQGPPPTTAVSAESPKPKPRSRPKITPAPSPAHEPEETSIRVEIPDGSTPTNNAASKTTANKNILLAGLLSAKSTSRKFLNKFTQNNKKQP